MTARQVRAVLNKGNVVNNWNFALIASSFVLAVATGCTVSSTSPDRKSADGGASGSSSSGGASSSEGSSGGGGSGSSGASGNAGASVPAEVIGTWTAGRGGTTVAYDTITGTSSSNASGLAFQFAADGTFAKAYRDSTGGSGCSTIVVGTEAGSVAWGEGSFQLHSDHGTTREWSSCTPSLVATQAMPDSDLDRAGYTYQMDGDVLVLTRDDGATARFQRSQ